MNQEQLEYFAYLLANDLINNKLESREILKGSFIPEFNMRNKIFRNPDEIILNTNELTSIIENGIYSKFKKNITLRDYLNMEDEYIFSKNDYAVLEKTNMEEFKKIMNTVITELVDLSVKNIFIDDKIYTTPFDKAGVYDTASNIGECKFPFFDKTGTNLLNRVMLFAHFLHFVLRAIFRRIRHRVTAITIGLHFENIWTLAIAAPLDRALGGITHRTHIHPVDLLTRNIE